jgi:hypothetical protein
VWLPQRATCGSPVLVFNEATLVPHSSNCIAGAKWLLRRLRSSAGNVWLALRQMLGSRLWMTTLTLLFTWMVAAFVYYGGWEMDTAVGTSVVSARGCGFCCSLARVTGSGKQSAAAAAVAVADSSSRTSHMHHR